MGGVEDGGGGGAEGGARDVELELGGGGGGAGGILAVDDVGIVAVDDGFLDAGGGIGGFFPVGGGGFGLFITEGISDVLAAPEGIVGRRLFFNAATLGGALGGSGGAPPGAVGFSKDGPLGAGAVGILGAELFLVSFVSGSES